MPDFKLYRSDDSLLIRGIGEHDIDLPNEDALRLADAIRAALAPTSGPRHKHSWTPEDDAKFRQLYAEGVPVAQIAERLSRGVAATVTRLSKLGIANRRPDQSARLRTIGPNRRSTAA